MFSNLAGEFLQDKKDFVASDFLYMITHICTNLML